MSRSISHRTLSVLLVYVVGFVLFSSWMALNSTREVGMPVFDSRAYYYAVQLAWQGENPFDFAAAQALALELTARPLTLTPYLYPPPSLMALAWMKPLTHDQSFGVLLLLGHLCLLGVLWMVHRSGGRWWTMALLITVWSPIHNTFEQGQVGVLILTCFAAAMLSRSPVGVAAGGLGKITPAAMLLWMARLRLWRPIVKVVAIGVGVYALSLLWISWEAQQDYLTRVLPALITGRVDTLGVPHPDAVTLNHSLGQFVRWTPGLDGHRAIAEGLLKLALVGVWFACPMRRPRAGAAALIVLITLMPALVWEAHFTYLLLPAWVGIESWSSLKRPWRALLVLSVLGCAVHSDWTEPIQWVLPELTGLWLVHKQLAALGLFAICVHQMTAEEASDEAAATVSR